MSARSPKLKSTVNKKNRSKSVSDDVAIDLSIFPNANNQNAQPAVPANRNIRKRVNSVSERLQQSNGGNGNNNNNGNSKQKVVKEWLSFFKKDNVPIKKTVVPKPRKSGGNLAKAVRSYEIDAAKATLEYDADSVEQFLGSFKPTEPSKVFIMEGGYPDKNKSAPSFSDKFAKKVPMTVDRTLRRSGHDNGEHGMTVGSLVHYNYPSANLQLDTVLGDPKEDFKADFTNSNNQQLQLQRSNDTLNLSFESYFDKLIKNNVKNSVINLSQMVRPQEKLSKAMLDKMIEVARGNNVIVFAMGNQSTNSNETNAFADMHKAIKKINDDESIKGSVVLVENVKKSGSANNGFVYEVASTSNYVPDPNKRSNVLSAVGKSTEIKTHRRGNGTGTSYSAPIVSALISKLSTAASVASGKPVDGKAVVAALVNTAEKRPVTKKSKYNKQGTAEANSNVAADEFSLNMPNLNRAFKVLINDL